MKTLKIIITFTSSDPIERQDLLHDVEETADYYGAEVDYTDDY